MNDLLRVQQLLHEIPPLMRELMLWNETPPDAAAFESSEPFCIDTMVASEWLQWIFLPRMLALLEGNMTLPSRSSVAPYFEEALKEYEQDPKALLVLLQQIDDLLNKDNQ